MGERRLHPAEVRLPAMGIGRLRPFVRERGWQRLCAAHESGAPKLAGRTIWMVNSTPVAAGWPRS